MAALLHQGAAGVAGKTVPVTDLGQKRVAVLTDRQHHRATAGRLAAHLVQQAGNGRHVAVFHGGPHGRWVAERQRA